MSIRVFDDAYRLDASTPRTLTSADVPLYDVVQPDTEIDRAEIGRSWTF